MSKARILNLISLIAFLFYDNIIGLFLQPRCAVRFYWLLQLRVFQPWFLSRRISNDWQAQNPIELQIFVKRGRVLGFWPITRFYYVPSLAVHSMWLVHLCTRRAKASSFLSRSHFANVFRAPYLEKKLSTSKMIKFLFVSPSVSNISPRQLSSDGILTKMGYQSCVYSVKTSSLKWEDNVCLLSHCWDV